MGHLSGKIADLVLRSPSDWSMHDYFLTSGTYARRRFQLTAEAQAAFELQNISFWADNPHFWDPKHRNPLLSLVWLALAMPSVGRKIVSEGVRLSHVGPEPKQVAAHLLNIGRRPDRAILEAGRILAFRYLGKPRRPGFLLPSASGTYALHYHAEQAPCPRSRITLSAQRDAFGMRRAAIDLRFSDQDIRSVIAAHDQLDDALRQAGVAQLSHHFAPAERFQNVKMQASDGYHQIGSTRMSLEAAHGVVDRDCRVHGIENLYVASTSVFPSSGQANPTLLGVMLALRLGDMLVNSRALSA
jgi:hypothetical protein